MLELTIEKKTGDRIEKFIAITGSRCDSLAYYKSHTWDESAFYKLENEKSW
jgi:hypothetical protein